MGERFTLVKSPAPPPPGELSASTAFPLAYWKLDAYGVVVFLKSSAHAVGAFNPQVWIQEYTLTNGDWVPDRGGMGADGWRGPKGPPGLDDGMEGRSLNQGGWIVKKDRA